MSHLDTTLFGLRWLLLVGVVAFAPLASLPYRSEGLLAGLALGVAANVLLGGLSFVLHAPSRVMGVLSALLDGLLAAIFFWATGGLVLPLLVFGTVAVLAAAARFGWSGLIGSAIWLGVLTVAVIFSLDDPAEATLVTSAIGLGLLPVLGMMGVALHGGGTAQSHLTLAERRQEALRLRSARERARAIFEMANTLSATLDHRRVLETAQALGTLALREDLGSDVRLISAVLLFQGKDNRLRVVTARGLTRADEATAIPGQRGLLGLALKGDEPVFGSDGNRDPELRYFAAFQEAKSILAIPLRAGFDVYGVMVFGANRPNAFSDEHVELMTAIGTQSTLALQNAVLYQDLLEEKERIVEVEEDARKKLARDLHDGPTQTVAAIAMRVNYIRRLIERQPQQAVEELWKIEDLARRTTKEIRHMLFTLRPLVLENQGLLAALHQLADKMRDTYDTNVIVEGAPEVEMYLDMNGQGVIFYIVEEAVNNARKHAQSEHIWVRLYPQDAFVVVEIEDDGVGFDVEAVDAGYERRGSLGMVNMRERAELVEGTLRIQSKRGEGTKISILVPIHPAAGPAAVGVEEPAPPLQLEPHRAQAGTPQFHVAAPAEPAASVAQESAPAAVPTPPPERISPPPTPAPAAPRATPSPAPSPAPAARPGTGPLKPLPSQARGSQPKKPSTGPLKPLPSQARGSQPVKPGTGQLKRLPSQERDSQPKKPTAGSRGTERLKPLHPQGEEEAPTDRQTPAPRQARRPSSDSSSEDQTR